MKVILIVVALSLPNLLQLRAQEILDTPIIFPKPNSVFLKPGGLSLSKTMVAFVDKKSIPAFIFMNRELKKRHGFEIRRANKVYGDQNYLAMSVPDSLLQILMVNTNLVQLHWV